MELNNKKHTTYPKIVISDKEEIRAKLTELRIWLPMTTEQIIFRAIDKYHQKHLEERRRTVPFHFRNSILKKQKFLCFYCKKVLRNKDATIDHKIPVARGGRTYLKNLVVACEVCNTTKEHLTDKEFADFLMSEPVITEQDDIEL